MKFFQTAVFGLIIAGLFSCQQNEKPNPEFYKDTVTHELLSELDAKVENAENMSTEDIQRLNAAIKYYAPIKDSLLGKTVGFLIEDQERRAKENSIKQLRATSISAVFNHSVGIDISEFRPVQDESGKDFNLLVTQVVNKSEQPIEELKGAIDFYNGQQLVKRFNINLAEQVPVDKQSEFNLTFAHDTSNQRDQIVRNNFKQLRKVWIPTYIKFADGTEYERNRKQEEVEEGKKAEGAKETEKSEESKN